MQPVVRVDAEAWPGSASSKISVKSSFPVHARSLGRPAGQDVVTSRCQFDVCQLAARHGQLSQALTAQSTRAAATPSRAGRHLGSLSVPRTSATVPSMRSATSLEELDRTFVLLCRFKRWERSQIPAFAGFLIRLLGIQPILARREPADHQFESYDTLTT